MALHDREEQVCDLLIALLQQIVVVEPFALLIVETGTALATTSKVEQANQVVHAHHLLIVSRIPAQKRQEIDDCLREVAALAIPRRDIACLRIMPL